MNENPHLLAIIESKMAQVKTNLEHNNPTKVKSLLEEVRIYTEEMQSGL